MNKPMPPGGVGRTAFRNLRTWAAGLLYRLRHIGAFFSFDAFH